MFKSYKCKSVSILLFVSMGQDIAIVKDFSLDFDKCHTSQVTRHLYFGQFRIAIGSTVFGE